MGLGLGVLLLVAGAILYWAVEIDIPGVTDNTLGVILMVVGGLAIVLTLVTTNMRTSRGDVTVTRSEGRTD